MSNLCNLDGAILAEAEARVPVLDRGFLFGDSIYEVVRTIAGVPFAWPEHLERLRASAHGLAMHLDLGDAEIMARVHATLAAAGNPESYVRIVVTRGTGSAPSIDLAQAPGPCRWVVLVRPLVASQGAAVRVQLVDRLRNDRRALDPALKSGNYLNNVLALAEAKAAGAGDCLMLNAAGQVTEASTANVFAVTGGAVATPPLDSGILAGVTRRLLIERCRARGLAVHERHLGGPDLRSADELFLASTLRDVAPVTHLDGAPVGKGGVGPVTRGVAEDFADFARTAVRERYGPELARLLARA